MTSILNDTPPTDTAAADTAAASRSPRLARVLVAVIAVAVLAIAVAGGYFWASRGSDTSTAASMPAASSVDAGFARDMTTHHQQAVTMAGYTRDNSTNPAVRLLAYDIDTSQTIQMGEMEGWLDTWGISRTSGKQMTWMDAYMGSAGVQMTQMHMAGEGLMSGSGSMPGMATPAQLNQLMTLHGKALDIMFLQLMIRHHQGGLPMERVAEQHASEAYVRTLAGNMLANQGTEIVQMEQLLRKLGGQPLPAPTY
ncbi:DUF305 domain-containing protein [uncultured Jatrophihabitans sp.]|uniref:DUF305 domain-containing protein n=1 Tax=uncultured Jatrophihabitans sp. TaxID=1610747 RepID=UPI0035CC3EC2